MKKILFLSLCLFGASAWASPGMGRFVSTVPVVEPPEWSEEPPLVTRQLEEGYRFEKMGIPALAERHYCAAGRLGSVEGQYRLARIYLRGKGPEYQPQWATSLLSIAASNGHQKAQELLAQYVIRGEALPGCMTTAGAELPPLNADIAIPHEIVRGYIRSLPADKQRHALTIERLAPRYQVDARLALAVARVESNFEAGARSPKNAVGLMQLIPETGQRFKVRDLNDPVQNIHGGLAYLRVLLNYFNGDVALALAAYNAGENAVIRHGGIPPYAETQEYVRRVMNYYRSPRHAVPTLTKG